MPRLPLFKNHHTHPSLFAALEKGVDISQIKDKSQALEAMASQNRPFTLVLGWNNSRYTFAPGELDHLPPLFICNACLHTFILNGPGRDRFGSEYPELVKNIDTPDWVETNLHLIFSFIVKTSNLKARDIANFYATLAREGTWSAEEKLLPGNFVLPLFNQAHCQDRTLIWAELKDFEAMDPQGQSQLHGIKIFLDGAIGARTAALSRPYKGGGYGLLLHTDSQLMEIIQDIVDTKKPVSAHAIGDRAVEQLLNVLEHLDYAQGKIPRVRLEHCQFISLDQAQRARALNITLSMQPNFSEDSLQYQDRLDTLYCQANNPFRMLIDQAGFIPGTNLLLGTDAPPHSAAYALQTSLFPPLSSQVLTLEEVKKGYCIDTLAPGYVEAHVDEKVRTVTTRVVLTPH